MYFIKNTGDLNIWGQKRYIKAIFKTKKIDPQSSFKLNM